MLGLTNCSFSFTIQPSIPTGTTQHPNMAKRTRTKPFENPATIQKVQRSIDTLVKRYLDENGSWNGELSSASIKELASNSIGRLEPRKFNERFFRGVGAGVLWDWFADLVVSCGHSSERETFQWLEAGSPRCFCGRPCFFADSKISNFCSRECANKSPKRKEAGAILSARAEELNERRRKTNIERYGVEWPTLRECHKKTVGLKSALRIIGQAAYDKLMDKDWIYEEYVIKRKSSKMIAEEVGVKCYGTVLDYVRKHGFEYEIDRRKVELSTSSVETKVMDFIRSLGIECVQSDRETIHPLELDILIPSHKLAFEINGVYWHGASNAEEDRIYRMKHRRKTEAAEAAGIRLVHLTDVEVITRWDTVSSMIESMLGASPEKIPARKGSVIEVPKAAAKAFLEENHIQGGGTWCHLYLGLVHEDRLVAVMGFDKARFDRSVPWELTRFANLRHTTVIGGFSKLLAHFEKDHEGSIVSYADYSRSQGNVYLKNGFERISISQPSYRWVSPDGRELFNRHMFMRRNLARVLTEFREEETEAQNCFREGYRRLWDCGQVKFIKKR